MTMSCDDTGTSGVRRFEVFTGAGRRRDWPDDVELAIVAESYAGLESASALPGDMLFALCSCSPGVACFASTCRAKVQRRRGLRSLCQQ